MIQIETVIVTTTRFDEVAERERINQAFKAKHQKARREMLLAMLDSFVAGDLAACYAQLLKMDQDTREHLNEILVQTIESVHEQVMAAARAVRRLEAKCGNNELSREEALRVQDVSRYSPRVSLQVDGTALPTTVPSLKRVQGIVCT